MFENEDLKRWLEDALKTLDEEDGKSRVVSAVLMSVHEDEGVMISCYNCNVRDKEMFASNLNAEAAMDTVLANVDRIRDALAELDDDEECGG